MAIRRSSNLGLPSDQRVRAALFYAKKRRLSRLNSTDVGPIPASSAIFAINGDSRTQQAVFTERSFGSTAMTDSIVNAADTKTNGWVFHCLNQLGNRIVLPRGCQFAIGAELTSNMAARAVQDAAQAAGFGATTMIFLGGVNDTTLTPAQSIANYTTIFNAFTAQGIRLVVCNELPRDSLETTSANHLARRDWLADPARAVTWPGMVQVDTFTPCLKPGTVCTWKSGYSYDGLHPAYAGSKIIGQTIAAAIASIYPSTTFPSLLQLPTPANVSGYLNASTAMMSGTGGINSGTPLPTGSVATGWTLSPTSGTQTGLNIVASKTVNQLGYDEQTIRIFGSSALTSGRGFALNTGIITAAVALPAGTKLRAYARLRIDAGYQGLFGAGIGLWCQGTNVEGAASGFTLRRGDSFLGNWAPNSSFFEMDGSAVDYTLMSQDLILPANWGTGTGKQVYLNLRGLVQSHGRAVDATIRISQFGLLAV